MNDPLAYASEHCTLTIRPDDDPGILEVEIWHRKRKKGYLAHVPTGRLQDMVDAADRAGQDAVYSPDLMDGGVTAAAIEAEVVSPDQARSLVQERDEAIERAELLEKELDGANTRAEEAEKARDEALADARMIAARYEERLDPRPLSLDGITDEMVKRGDDAWSGMDHFSARIPSAVVTTILRAALTEPAPEPTEAEKIAALVDAWHLDGHPRTTLPLYLASNGVRVTGSES